MSLCAPGGGGLEGTLVSRGGDSGGGTGRRSLGVSLGVEVRLAGPPGVEVDSFRSGAAVTVVVGAAEMSAWSEGDGGEVGWGAAARPVTSAVRVASGGVQFARGSSTG